MYSVPRLCQRRCRGAHYFGGNGPFGLRSRESIGPVAQQSGKSRLGRKVAKNGNFINKIMYLCLNYRLKDAFFDVTVEHKLCCVASKFGQTARS